MTITLIVSNLRRPPPTNRQQEDHTSGNGQLPQLRETTPLMPMRHHLHVHVSGDGALLLLTFTKTNLKQNTIFIRKCMVQWTCIRSKSICNPNRVILVESKYAKRNQVTCACYFKVVLCRCFWCNHGYSCKGIDVVCVSDRRVAR